MKAHQTEPAIVHQLIEATVVFKILPFQRSQERPQIVQYEKIKCVDGAGPVLFCHRRVDSDAEVLLAASDPESVGAGGIPEV